MAPTSFKLGALEHQCILCFLPSSTVNGRLITKIPSFNKFLIVSFKLASHVLSHLEKMCSSRLALELHGVGSCTIIYVTHLRHLDRFLVWKSRHVCSIIS